MPPQDVIVQAQWRFSVRNSYHLKPRFRYGPDSAVMGIRSERQLSGDKLPSAAIMHDGRR